MIFFFTFFSFFSNVIKLESIETHGNDDALIITDISPGQIIGSSLLFVHDLHKADVWMIDFAKTHPIPKNMTITHTKDWMIGNHEDGYLIGVDNIIKIFTVLDGLSKL